MPESAPLRWRDRRFLVLLALGFSAGVPLPLTAFTLRQWFAESGVSLAAIGLTALIGLAYSLKFLWAPVLDHAAAPLFRRWGRRRGWLASIQPALALAILALGLTDPAADATLTVMVAVAVAFLSASQDIVVDAYRIEALAEREQGYGLACYVWGYRGALLAAGGGALAMAEFGGWSFAFAMCAAMIGVGFAATIAAPEPGRPPPEAPPGWGARLRIAVVEPFADFVRRRHWFVILAFVALFKLGEALAGIMTPSFYRALGFSRLEVASVSSVFGLFATLAGALAGGWLVARIGTARALILTGLGQMLSNLMYVALYYAGHDIGWLFAQVGIENFTDGLADAAFITYLSALTSRAFTATQYALLSSLAAVPLRTLGASSGWLAEMLGWPAFFLMTTFAAVPAMAIMLWLLRHLPPPAPPEDRR
ncbi:AmpG family muropeptide MFS transporter [Roseomonas alkaliterrae]|uniref:PAT family beta-lactamase induction signal transducer AmpG n=1 Tax=Neoroseomonas alkaliterrae TaxID=1452450 RepID=A0A840XXS4_9PROT|nr:MFS transporter [Neoroseomonas alkaliterrae]MBB5691409.1 PAT family beta-lactamase induction signal transducer AmpG [Neoroseomonas alkaliterrae]MBR0675545.1 AmpG family muropeptide MFS transporter [Neoroseomonas alkaliterrae]